MSSPVWMPLYVGDYLADTSHLSTIEHGAYMLLIMHYWRHGGLPDDEAKLARICRMNARQWDAAKGALRDLFKDGWRHSRIDEELKFAADKSAARASSGMRGGIAKSLKTNDADIANATNLPENQPSKNVGSRATQSHTQSEKKEESASHSNAREKNPDDGWPPNHLELFLSAYPRRRDVAKVGPKLATLRKSGLSWDVLIAGAHRYAAECRGTDPKFIKLPMTWLNAGSWANEPDCDYRPIAPTNGYRSAADTVLAATRDRLARIADAERRTAGGNGYFADPAPTDDHGREQPRWDHDGEGPEARDEDHRASALFLPSPSLFS